MFRNSVKTIRLADGHSEFLRQFRVGHSGNQVVERSQVDAVTSLVQQGKILSVGVTVADDVVEYRALDEHLARRLVEGKRWVQQNLATSGKTRPSVFLILVQAADAHSLAEILLMDADDVYALALAVITHNHIGLIIPYLQDSRVWCGEPSLASKFHTKQLVAMQIREA